MREVNGFRAKIQTFRILFLQTSWVGTKVSGVSRAEKSCSSNLIPTALVITRRPVKRFTEMTSDEVSDLFQSAQIIGRVIEQEYRAESLTMAVQVGYQSIFRVFSNRPTFNVKEKQNKNI